MSRFSADWGNYQERAHKFERDTTKYHEIKHERIRAKAYEAMDRFDIQQGLLDFEAAVDRGNITKAKDSPTVYVKRPYSPTTRPGNYNYGKASTRPRSLDAQVLERLKPGNTMENRASNTQTFYTTQMMGQWSILDQPLMVGNKIEPIIPALKMQRNEIHGYHQGDRCRTYTNRAESVPSHLLRRSLSMPLSTSGSLPMRPGATSIPLHAPEQANYKQGSWGMSSGLQKAYFLPNDSEDWTGTQASGHAPTVIRPTRAHELRTKHIQTGLSELLDEKQREDIRCFNMNRNGNWRHVYPTEEESHPPLPWGWIEDPKKRTDAEAKALDILKSLSLYFAERKIRVKEMFQPYVPYGPDQRVDPETLMLALRRFHLAEDWTLKDILSLMLVVDPYCNGTILLTELDRIMFRVDRLPEMSRAPVEKSNVITQPLMTSKGSTITVSPAFKNFDSSFNQFVKQLDSTVGSSTVQYDKD
jgi:hypothetical protein